MKFSIRFADQIVGAFIIAALAILVVVIFMLGKSQRWFARDNEYITYLKSASGVSINMSIQFKGFTIGHVKNISLSPDDQVEVKFTIFEEYTDKVKYGSVVEFQAAPIAALGSSFIFHPGRGTELIPEGSVIPELSSDMGKQLVVNNMVDKPETTDIIGNMLNSLDDILLLITEVLEDLSDITEDLSEQVSPILANLVIITDQMASPGGTIMQALEGDGAITAMLDSLAGVIKNMEDVSDFIPAQLPQLGVMVGDLNVVLRQVEDLLTALANNPLLRGGIPERVETSPGGAGYRDMEF